MKALVRKRSRSLSIGEPTRRFPPPDSDAIRLSLARSASEPALDRSVILHGRPDLYGRFTKLSDGVHYRVDMEGKFTGSHYEFCFLDEGFILTAGDFYFTTPNSVFGSFPDTLRIYVASDGDGESVFADGRSLSLKAPNSAVIVEPPNGADSSLTTTGQTRYACVFLRRKALKALYGGREDELPGGIQAFAKGHLQEAMARSIRLTPGLLRCLEDILGCELRGQRRRLYMQSKAVEIVCQALEAADSEPDIASVETTKLAASGVLKARRLLADNFVTPPSLQDLAREVGMSRTALCTGFRQILGQSVFDYIEDLRMQQALVLLNDHTSTVTEIAHAVGYNHSSSFSVAIHRRFGATPSDLRRRAIPMPL